MKIAESILNALAEPVLLLDENFHAVLANPAFMNNFGVTPANLAGAEPHTLMPGESSRARMKVILDAIRAGETEVDGVEVKGASPPTVFSLRARRVKMVSGYPEMILVEFRDITRERDKELRINELNNALKRHAADLHRTNQDLESFTHSASHDLRTPLRLTGKVAHMLLHDHTEELSPTARKKVQMILDTTEEMGNLLENLLSFSRLSHIPLKKRTVDPARLAREVLRSLNDERAGRDIKIDLAKLPPCQADKALLKQVYQNLIANALKFTRPRERAEIRIGFMQPNGEGVYFVKDNGVGLDTSQPETIFNSFHRLSNAQGFEGSGIGLSLVKRIVERHDGRIWAEGEAGQGTAIYFTLGETAQPERTTNP